MLEHWVCWGIIKGATHVLVVGRPIPKLGRKELVYDRTEWSAMSFVLWDGFDAQHS